MSAPNGWPVETARAALIGAARRGLIVWTPQGWRPARHGPPVNGVRPMLPPLHSYWADLVEILIRDKILIHPRELYPAAAFRPLTVDEHAVHGKLEIIIPPRRTS